MILLSKKDAAAAGGDGGNVSSPNFDTIMCVLLSRFWKRSSLVDDAPTGESGGVIVVSTKTPRCFCPWCVASPDRAASARTTNTQTDRKDDDRIIISLSKRFRCSLGENEWSAVARSLSLSLFSTPQRKRRPTKDTRRALNTKRQNDEGLFASSSFSLRGILFAAFPKATKKKKKKKNEEKSVKK